MWKSDVINFIWHSCRKELSLFFAVYYCQIFCYFGVRVNFTFLKALVKFFHCQSWLLTELMEPLFIISYHYNIVPNIFNYITAMTGRNISLNYFPSPSLLSLFRNFLQTIANILLYVLKPDLQIAFDIQFFKCDYPQSPTKM